MDDEKYQEILQKQKAFGKWVYITPISGVMLTKDVKNEFQINRVTIISKEKAKNRLARLINSYSKSKNKKYFQDFINSSDTFAITRCSGKPNEVRSYCRNLVKKELAILTISHLGYGRRRSGPNLSLQIKEKPQLIEDILIEDNKDRVLLTGETTGNQNTLVLHGHWLRFQKSNYFIKLLKILRGDIKIAKEWREDIERAAILIGQGLSFNDVSQSFLWNMIALETLFNEGEERFSKEFPKRAEAFLGWVGFWEEENYSQKIGELYSKRCDFVHDGRRNHINNEDLFFTDNLIFNLLINIIRHPKIFFSKKAVIKFSKKVEAEYLLGIKSKSRPKSLVFIKYRNYEKEFREF